MTSIPYTADWWYSGQPNQRCRRGSSTAPTITGAPGRPTLVRASDVRLTDERGVELGTIVAPRHRVVLAAHGPTLYLQRR